MSPIFGLKTRFWPSIPCFFWILVILYQSFLTTQITLLVKLFEGLTNIKLLQVFEKILYYMRMLLSKDGSDSLIIISKSPTHLCVPKFFCTRMSSKKFLGLAVIWSRLITRYWETYLTTLISNIRLHPTQSYKSSRIQIKSLPLLNDREWFEYLLMSYNKWRSFWHEYVGSSPSLFHVCYNWIS